jgi:uncharacterized protein YbjT (DUF2867 family)
MILVVGSTGQLGSMITSRLLNQGHEVRILVRPQSNFQPLVEAGAQPVYGDLKDRASLDMACKGIDTVITTATAAQRGGEDTFESVDLIGNRNLIDAAKAANVRHFIFTSALGSDPNSPNPLMAAKGQTEAHLRESGVPFTMLAPDMFMEVWVGIIVGMPLQMGAPVSIVGEGNRKHSFTSVDDVARYAVTAVTHPEALNQYIPLGGPEPITWMDVITTVSDTLGQPLRVNHLQPGELIPNLPPEITYLMAATESYDSPVEMTSTAQKYGVEPTSIQAFAERTFRSDQARAQ